MTQILLKGSEGMIEVRHVKEYELEDGLKVLVDSFEKESFTSYVYDFSKRNTKELFYLLAILKAKVYLNVGNYIFLAMKEDVIVGIAIVKKDIKIALKKVLKIVFPDVFKAMPLLTKINWKNAIRASSALKYPQSLKEPYVILEALAVHPNYQGQGISKVLMEKVHQISETEATGTYLFTSDKRNQQIYEHLGYRTIEVRQGGALQVYHMYRNT